MLADFKWKLQLFVVTICVVFSEMKIALPLLVLVLLLSFYIFNDINCNHADSWLNLSDYAHRVDV